MAESKTELPFPCPECGRDPSAAGRDGWIEFREEPNILRCPFCSASFDRRNVAIQRARADYLRQIREEEGQALHPPSRHRE